MANFLIRQLEIEQTTCPRIWRERIEKGLATLSEKAISRKPSISMVTGRESLNPPSQVEPLA